MNNYAKKWAYDKWSATLNPITHPLPVVSGQQAKEIVFFYYIFANYGNLSRAPIYIHECLHNYNLLLKNTNIETYGGMLFFVDRVFEPVATPIFESVGLLEIVEYMDVGNLMNMAGYFGCFDHPRIEEYRYALNLDSDMWFIAPEPIDIGAFLRHYDAYPDRTYYANEGEGYIHKVQAVRDGKYEKDLINFYRVPELRDIAEKVMYELFDSDFPSYPQRYTSGKNKALRTKTDLTAELSAFYAKYGRIYQEDEAFSSVWLSYYRNIPTAPPMPKEILQTSPRVWEDRFYEMPILVDVGIWSDEAKKYPKVMRFIAERCQR